MFTSPSRLLDYICATETQKHLEKILSAHAPNSDDLSVHGQKLQCKIKLLLVCYFQLVALL